MFKTIELKILNKQKIKYNEKSKRESELFEQEVYKSNIPIIEKQFILSFLPSKTGNYCKNKKSYKRFIKSLNIHRKTISSFKDVKENNDYQECLRILELPIETYDIKIIKSQYKNLCVKYHPDTNQTNNFSENKIKEITNAYEQIKNI